MSTTLAPASASASGSGVVRHSGQRPRWLAVFVAIVLLAIGGVGGWMIGSRDEDHPKTVVAGYESLTARQKQMVDVYEQGAAAWRKGDARALSALFTADAVFANANGSYQRDLLPWLVPAGGLTLELLDPIVVNGNLLTVVQRYSGAAPVTEVFQFATAGAVLISHYNAFASTS